MSFLSVSIPRRGSSVADRAEYNERQQDVGQVSIDLAQSWKDSSFSGIPPKREKVKFDVFVTDPMRVDLQVFSLWIKGYSDKEASSQRKPPYHGIFGAEVTNEIIFRETADQYRNFKLLEPYLQVPTRFSSQQMIQIDKFTFYKLVEKYYEISETVMRELAGKKLKKKLRGNLDDMSEKIKTPLKTCVRQFDNLKRIISIVTEECKKREHTIVQIIQRYFCLPKKIAERYWTYVFMSYHRIETSDKKLKLLSATDFEFLTSILIKYWTTDKTTLELDSKFKETIRDCKTLLINDKSTLEKYKSLVMGSMTTLSEKKHQNLGYKFHIIIKALLNIGAGISKSKEFEDIFEDIEEKLLDPCTRVGLTSSEINQFFHFLISKFDALMDSVQQLSLNRHRQKTKQAWVTFLEGISACLAHMFQQSVKVNH